MRPPRRYQQPFLPIEPSGSAGRRLFARLERALKGVLFNCRMCGTCILQETEFICPMTCPKGLRNGPCGQSGEERCVVDASRPCTWHLIFRRAERRTQLEEMLEINAPIDGARAGHSAWLDLFDLWRHGKDGPRLMDWLFNRSTFNRQAADLFYAYRQPDWWQGDSVYHPPAYEAPVSVLEENLRTRPLTLTVDIMPPDDIAVGEITRKATFLKAHVTAANYSDNAFAIGRVSSFASCILSLEAGLEPVLQIQSRDRNRFDIQAQAVSAAALGIRNILCLSGNYIHKSLPPLPPPDQFDVDAVQMLWILRRMRDEGHYLDGREIPERPQFFLGAAGAPFAAPHQYEAIRTEKKVNAGAQFIQTQMIYDVDRFTGWLEALDRRGLLNRVAVLASVALIDDAEMVRSMSGDPGMSIPPQMINRLEDAAQKDAPGSRDNQRKAAAAIMVETIVQLKDLPGLRGIHLLLDGVEHLAPQIIANTGLAV